MVTPDKRILIVSQNQQQATNDLGDLILNFNTDRRDRIPDDFEHYDAIVIHHIPDNIAELADNYEIPVLALESLAEALKSGGHDIIAEVMPQADQVSRVKNRLEQKERVLQIWSGEIQGKLKMKYLDLKPALDEAIAQQRIPRYVAFFSYVERFTPAVDEYSKAISVVSNRIYLSFKSNLDNLEKCLGTPNEEFFRKAAEKDLGEYLDYLQNRREYLKNTMKLRGQSVGGGSHYLVKPDLTLDSEGKPEFRFLKEMRDAKGIPSEVIARVVYRDAKYYNQAGGLLLPDSKQPIRHGSKSYLLREAITGPDLEKVLQFIRRRIGKNDTRKSWLRQFRDIIVYQVFRDIIQWQNTAPPINEPQIPATNDWIVKHMQSNLNAARTTFSRYLQLNAAEEALWQECIGIFNPICLDLNKDTIKRHFDASTKNIKLYTRDTKTPQIEDLERLIGTKSSRVIEDSAKKNLRSKLYYVDTGYTYMHRDEDFFHVACSFELHEEFATSGERLSPQDKLKTIENYYRRFNGFRGLGRKKPDSLTYFLHGFYRCFVSGHLNINEYELEKKQHQLYAEKVHHRLGLAEAFAEDAITFIEKGLTLPNTVRNEPYDPDKALGHIKSYQTQISQATRPDQREQYKKKLEAEMLRGLQYFASKFSRIKLQNPPASQPAAQ